MKYNDSKKYVDLKTKAKTTVHSGKQGEHILGHNNYQGGSYVFDTVDIQDLVNKYAENEELKFKPDGNWNKVEIIEIDEYIGMYINKNKIEIYETKRFSIHYSKIGIHIVPRKEN